MPDLDVIFPEGSNENWKWLISEDEIEDEELVDEEQPS